MPPSKRPSARWKFSLSRLMRRNRGSSGFEATLRKICANREKKRTAIYTLCANMSALSGHEGDSHTHQGRRDLLGGRSRNRMVSHVTRGGYQSAFISPSAAVISRMLKLAMKTDGYHGDRWLPHSQAHSYKARRSTPHKQMRALNGFPDADVVETGLLLSRVGAFAANKPSPAIIVYIFSMYGLGVTGIISRVHSLPAAALGRRLSFPCGFLRTRRLCAAARQRSTMSSRDAKKQGQQSEHRGHRRGSSASSSSSSTVARLRIYVHKLREKKKAYCCSFKHRS